MSWKQKKRCLELLAAEEGWVRKAWGETLSVCLVYPNHYRTGMSNLGFQAVYAQLNAHPAALCERLFLPEPADGGLPPLSLESQRPLADFDIVAFSLSFENDYPGVLEILSQAGIPAESAARGSSHPLLLGGGIAVTLNPEPLADFFDLFLLGEAEAVLPGFLDLVTARRDLARESLLDAIQKTVAGAYVPRFYRVEADPDGRIVAREPCDPAYPRRIARPWAAALDAFSTEQAITTTATELGGIYLTEVSRGCGRGCRFCAAGFVCRPVRFRSAAALAPSFRRGIERGRTIGLLGTAVSDHPALPSLCRQIVEQGGKVAIGSLRIDRVGDEIAALLSETRVETVSIAPEAGSERLRRVIHKGIREREIFSAVEKLMEYGIVRAKLYFMVGLPTETDGDAEAIADLVSRILRHARERSPGRRGFRSLTVGLNQFIPKAATPFQWHPLAAAAVVRRRVRIVREGVRGEKAVRVTHDLPKWNYIQALLARGDRQVGSILLAAHRLGGNWARALREVGLDADRLVYRARETDETLPWDFIDHGVPKQTLINAYRAALSGTEEES